MAEAARLSEAAVDSQPTNSVARLTRSFAWLNLHQYERVVVDGEDWTPVNALTLLGRSEEASLLAFKRADEQADVGTLFSFLNTAGRSAELIAYLEERWPSLAEFRKDFPPYAALGDQLMIDVALAYSRAGNQERFDRAMAYVRDTHANLIEIGVVHPVFLMNEAAYQALAGNHDASLAYLDRAIRGGVIVSSPISLDYPALASLEGDPRYQEAQSRMIERLNNERKKLGLEPSTI